MEALDKVNAGQMPSPFGEMEIVIPGAPVSVQAKKAIRDAYLGTIKSALSRFQFILTGQLTLDITWFVSAKSRYETDAKSDIDNCLKPILDAFTGPKGLFIDDCQMKGLYICWRHIESDNERLSFQFRFDPDQWCEKTGIAFIRLGNGLCSHVSLTWPKPIRAAWVQAMRSGESQREILEQLGAPYLAIAGLTGGSQPFHATRTGGFALLTADEFASYDDGAPNCVESSACDSNRR